MRLRRTLARLLTLTATLPSLGIAVNSSAHAVLTYPLSRDGADANKTGPCGVAPTVNGPNAYTPGQSMTVTWKETVKPLWNLIFWHLTAVLCSLMASKHLFCTVKTST